MGVTEVQYLAELLGKNRPEVRRMLQNASLNPHNVHLIQKHMMLMVRQQGFDLSSLPVFTPKLPEQTSQNGIFAGNILFGDRYAGKLIIPVESFSEHTLNAGHSGCGKSFLNKLIVPQLAEKGVCVKIFDSENEYKALLRKTGPGDVYVFSPQTDKDNFLEPPSGVPPKEWLANLKNLIREVFYLRDGSMNLLHTILHELFEKRGLIEGGKDYPTIMDLVAILEKLQFRPGSRFSGYHESLVNRFKGLLENLGDTLCCKRGYDLTKEQGRISIFRTGSLSDDTRNFYISLKMMKEAAFRETLPPEGLKTVFLVEEAHKLYNEKIAKRYDLGEPMLFSSSRTFRKRGIGCIYSDQVPSELPSALSGNVNNHFVFRLVNGKCIWRISQSINLKPQQAEILPVMPKRQCIFQSGDYPDPLLIEVPELSFEFVSEEEVDEHMKPILSKLKYTPVTDGPAVELRSNMLGSKSRGPQVKPSMMWKDILNIVAKKQPISLTEIYQSSGNVNHWYGRKIVTQMENQELIEGCPVSFGTRGNPKTFVVLRSKGAEFIGADYEKAKLKGKGETEHVILQNLLAQALRDSGKTVSIEYYANGKSVDIAEIREDKSTAYEIELAPSHPHVAENVQRDLDAGFSMVVVVTRNKDSRDEAKGQVYKNVDWEKLPKVEFRLLRDFQ
jgi:hypothetical protein